MNLCNLRCAWWRYRGEEPLLTTFWVHDYRPGSRRWLNGRCYRITHYLRSAADPCFFEVWGKEVQPAVARSRARGRHTARDYTSPIPG